MPTKRTKHPLIREIQLGKTVEEVIAEHFAGYDLQEPAHEALPAIIREVIRINKSDLQFQVRTLADESWIMVLNAISDLCIEYWEYNQEDRRVALEEEAYRDCKTLNEIVRKLYGVKRERPKATLTREQFVKKKGEVCPYCRGNALDVLDETRPEWVIVGCTQCGATWEKTSQLVVKGFTEWRHGR